MSTAASENRESVSGLSVHVAEARGIGAIGCRRESQSRIAGDELEVVTAQNDLRTPSGVLSPGGGALWLFLKHAPSTRTVF